LVLSYGLDDEFVVVVSCFVEPVGDTSDGLGDVVGIGLEFIVINVLVVVQIRLIDEMPRGLPGASVVLDIVSESDTLGESMFVFTDWESVLLKDGKNGFDLGYNLWVSLLKNFLSNSCCHEMCWPTPSGNCG
jgi:hypothetical protein